MNKWHIRYCFPVTFETGPITTFDPSFDRLFIRTSVYDELDRYLDNISGQHGKFWISGHIGGFGKSTMLNYIARKLFSEVCTLKALPIHISISKEESNQTVEQLFIKDFLDKFLDISENLWKANRILGAPISADITTNILDDFDTHIKEIKNLRNELPQLDQGQLESKFYTVLDSVLLYWLKKGIFNKYVLLIDEMDKLDTNTALAFLGRNQKLFENFYQKYNFVVFLTGHSSWVERIIDGTEYNFYKGVIFRIPPFQDIEDVHRLVEARLVQSLHMIPNDNPWTEEGYEELLEMSGGVPRIIIQLNELAINEAQRREITSIGRGILREIVVTEKNLAPIESYLKGHIETYLKAKSAFEKHVDSLLYMYYNEPGHRIAKTFDKDLTGRTRYLGIEINNDEWIDQIRTLVKLECLEEEELSRQLSKDLSDLFDRLGRDLDLMSRVIPAIVKKLGDIKPKIPAGNPVPPDCQKIIDNIFAAHRDQWITKELIRTWFNDSTQMKNYAYTIANGQEPESLSKTFKALFDKEYERYIRRTSSNLMMMRNGELNHYRRFPDRMDEEDFTILKVFDSTEIIDKYIQYVIYPNEYDNVSIKNLDALLETVLKRISDVRGLKFENNCVRLKKKRVFIESNLALSPSVNRRLKFYVAETQTESFECEVIKKVIRQIILDLSKEFDVFNRAEKFCSCFISYGEPDKKFALKLKAALSNSGIVCWTYASDSTVGEQTWKEISKKRNEAQKMLLVCSIRSLSRDGVKKELEQQIDEDENKIIPLSLDNDWKNSGFDIIRGQNNLKQNLLKRNYVDFSDELNFETSIMTLKKALKLKTNIIID